MGYPRIQRRKSNGILILLKAWVFEDEVTWLLMPLKGLKGWI